MERRCPKCSSDQVVENSALNKTFLYCRTCKEEVNTQFDYGALEIAALAQMGDFAPLEIDPQQIEQALKDAGLRLAQRIADDFKSADDQIFQWMGLAKQVGETPPDETV